MNPAPQCRHLLETYGKLLDDLDDSHRAMAPVAEGKTAGWLVGHLCITGDFGRRLCGRKPALCPVEWRPLFSPGTTPSTTDADYPPMNQMVELFRAVYSDLITAYPAATPETLNAENSYSLGRERFPTAGEFVGWMMTGHLGYHLGQLSGWRDSAGI